MTIQLSDAVFWLAIVAPALIGIGAVLEYVGHAIHHDHRKGQN